MDTIEFEITRASSALLMHNERLANPLDPACKALKAISGKKNKTDEDHLEMAWVEFQGGIYHDEEIGPYIPAQWIEATIRDSAKMSKRGTDVKRGVMVPDDRIPIMYDGPRDVEGLYKAGFYDQRMVKNQGSAKVLRTRPAWRQWKAKFTVVLDTGIFDKPTVISLLENAGRLIGIGDYRPRFGKFTVEVL